MNVKVIRMWSGEDVVTDVVKEDDESITIVNPIVAIPSGQGTLGFAPWAPIIKKGGTEITIPKSYVVYLLDTQDGIIDQYSEMFSTIKTPDKKKLIL